MFLAPSISENSAPKQDVCPACHEPQPRIIPRSFRKKTERFQFAIPRPQVHTVTQPAVCLCASALGMWDAEPEGPLAVRSRRQGCVYPYGSQLWRAIFGKGFCFAQTSCHGVNPSAFVIFSLTASREREDPTSSPER